MSIPVQVHPEQYLNMMFAREQKRETNKERETQRQRQKHREREQKSHKTCSDKSETVTDNKIKHNFNMVSYTAIIKQYKT